jgi:predicted dienelactone hydrolase
MVYNLDSGVATTFGIPATRHGQDLYFPTNIAAMGKLPIVVLGHGNGHNFQWYDHIGNHLASYGYVVVSHGNDTGPGSNSAASTTLGHTDAFINQAEAGAIAGGQLVGHIDARRIVWIGHSRGAEGVAIAYDRLFDATATPANYSRADTGW